MTSASIADQLVLIGCGNMGYALLRGWLDSGTLQPANVHVVEPVFELRERAAHLGVNVHGLPSTLPPRADIVVLALKPQVLAAELPVYRHMGDSALFVSIAAGVTVAKLNVLLGGARVVRAIPNTPAAVGKGSTIVFAGNGIEPVDLHKVKTLFAAGGSVHQVEDEVLVNAATAISGSGPAYIFYLMECLTEAAQNLGLPEGLARMLVTETVHGAGALALGTEVEPAELRRQVTSPKGTTEAALEVLMAGGTFSSIIQNTARAAFDRSIALSASA